MHKLQTKGSWAGQMAYMVKNGIQIDLKVELNTQEQIGYKLNSIRLQVCFVDAYLTRPTYPDISCTCI